MVPRLGALAALLLAGCATLEPPPVPALHTQPALETFGVVGRLSLRQGNEGFSGNLDWRHSAARDEFVVLSPLGQGVARLVRDASGVVVETAGGQVLRAADAESLTEEVLGARLPLSALSRWVQGEALGDAHITRDAAGTVTRIVEAGWQIDYLGHVVVSGRRLPQRIFAESGELRLRLIVDRWELPTP